LTSQSSSLESLQAKYTILERENQELKAAAASKRKPRRGATVKHIGRHHFTDPASAEAVLEVELGGTGNGQLGPSRGYQREARGQQKRVPSSDSGF